MTEKETGEDAVTHLYEKLRLEALASGYYLHPDKQFTKDLIASLIVNQERYGYPSCPCRLAAGNRQADMDIVCPCDYRDPDLDEYGACYCALYVSQAAFKGEKKITSVPERRPAPEQRGEKKTSEAVRDALPYPVWRCRVCGYLCARE